MRDIPANSLHGGLRRTALAAALLAALAGAQTLTTAHAAVPEPAAREQLLPGNRPGSFADLIERVGPAVVNIAIERAVDAAAPLALPENTPYPEFFERFFGNRAPQSGTPRKAQGQGSGFIVDAAGHIVTNNHVIDGADAIRVTTHDGTQYTARRIGVDPKTDLALLKIDAGKALPHVRFGDSDATRVGDWVVAIGNPFGLGGSATAGIVSARGRDLKAGPFDDFIQVDAPINRGNSGGPLFDERGNVVGVNSAIYSPNGGSVGIGFAIPSALARHVIDQLREHGTVARGWLGVQVQPVTAEVAASLGLDTVAGALVADVVDGSPAASGGLRAGDVIVRYAGQPVAELRDLPRLVAETPADTRVTIEVWRDGADKSLTVAITGTPETPAVAAATADHGDPAAPADAARLGLALAELTPELRREFGLAAQAEGVLVTGVAPDSPAARRGLRRGDLLQMVGQTAVRSVADVVRELHEVRSAARDSVLLLVSRDDSRRFVTLDFA